MMEPLIFQHMDYWIGFRWDLCAVHEQWIRFILLIEKVRQVLIHNEMRNFPVCPFCIGLLPDQQYPYNVAQGDGKNKKYYISIGKRIKIADDTAMTINFEFWRSISEMNQREQKI